MGVELDSDIIEDTVYEVIFEKFLLCELKGNVFVSDIVTQVLQKIPKEREELFFLYGDDCEENLSEEEKQLIVDYIHVVVELQLAEVNEWGRELLEEDDYKAELERELKQMSNDDYDDEEDDEEEYEGYEDDGDMNEDDDEYEPEMEGEDVDSHKRKREEYGDWADFNVPSKKPDTINVIIKETWWPINF